MTLGERVRQWAIEKAFPLWAERGVDRDRGGFVESLDMEGQANTLQTRRVRTQARQIFSFSHAYNVGWISDCSIAMQGLSYLTDKAWMAGDVHGWAQCLDETGAVVNPVRDLYDHACVLLALGSVYKASEDPYCLELADQTLGFLDEDFAEKNGGYSEQIGGQLPRRQNPHMHLFEALLVLYEATGEARYLSRADDIFYLFNEHLFDENKEILREYFNQDWTDWAQGKEDIWEPGHHSEWVWLLKKYSDFSGKAVHAGADALFRRIRMRGIAPSTGLLLGRLGADGSIRDVPSRTWMQTEYIKALLTRHEEGDDMAAQQVELAVDKLFKYHLDPAIPGSWIDQIDAEGKACSTSAPASTLYHLLYCMTETERVLGRA